MRKTDIYIYDFQNASKVNIFFGITFFLSNSELQKSYNVLVKPIIIIPSYNVLVKPIIIIPS